VADGVAVAAGAPAGLSPSRRLPGRQAHEHPPRGR